MDYSLHYSRLITRSIGRNIVGYLERHHILPKCMGGTNHPDNFAGKGKPKSDEHRAKIGAARAKHWKQFGW